MNHGSSEQTQWVEFEELLALLKPKQRRGSRPRCHLLTHGAPEEVAARLTGLVAPFGRVRSEDRWLPRGFDDLEEAKLGKTPGFLPEQVGEAVTDWWLAVRRSANVPNWDIASTCLATGEPGLILVEAKAHAKELSRDGKKRPSSPNGWANHRKIEQAIQQANAALNGILPGWALSADSHYQLCNRFAWAWKLASLRVPVILVYLGFLNAGDMAEPFESPDAWERAVREYSCGLVPATAWGKALDVNGTPLGVLIRSMQVDLPAGGEA